MEQIPEGIDLPRIERAVREILLAVGEDPDRDGLLKTPNRVARMYGEMFRGLWETPERHLETVFDEDHHEMVILREIPFHSMCEHHLLPFSGEAHIAYIPGGKIVGLSKLARIVDAFAARPQVQERLNEQVLVALQTLLGTDDVAVSISATHFCVKARGVMDANSETTTTSLGGRFKTNTDTRKEFLLGLQQSA